MDELQLYKVEAREDGSYLCAYLVAAESFAEALELMARANLTPSRHPDVEVRITCEVDEWTGDDRGSRVLLEQADEAIYRDQGWAEDGDEEGPDGMSCDSCGLYGWASVERSLVCEHCQLCAGCAMEDAEEETCPECGLPGVGGV